LRFLVAIRSIQLARESGFSNGWRNFRHTPVYQWPY
jgi:hypothetical protein